MSCILLPLCLLLSQQTPAEVRVVPQKSPAQVEVLAPLPAGKLPELKEGQLTQDQGEAVLRLTLHPEGAKQPGVAMLGSYQRRKDGLVFRPRFDLQYGQRYRIFFEPQPGQVTTV